MQRNSSSRMIFKRPPTHCGLVVVPAGAIFAQMSEVDIDGNAKFTNNYAAEDGGMTQDYASIVHLYAWLFISCTTSLQSNVLLLRQYTQGMHDVCCSQCICAASICTLYIDNLERPASRGTDKAQSMAPFNTSIIHTNTPFSVLIAVSACCQGNLWHSQAYYTHKHLKADASM